MKVVDLNVLLYAVNSSSPQHRVVHAWWERAVTGPEPVGLAWIVIGGFLRLSTKAGLFPHPLSVEDACERVSRWLAQPNIRVVQESDEQWLHLERILRRVGAAGNLTTDAQLAALAISHGASVASCDSDFARFPGLRWENPLADA